jgi:hypothetical protein
VGNYRFERSMQLSVMPYHDFASDEYFDGVKIVTETGVLAMDEETVSATVPPHEESGPFANAVAGLSVVAVCALALFILAWLGRRPRL